MGPDSDQEGNQINNKKIQVKKADKQKQFKQQGQSKQLFQTAQQFYEALQPLYNTLRPVRVEHPKLKGVQIIDVSLRARGPMEDQVYTTCPFYRNNIRRGNTLLLFEKQAQWGRKGLQKFFDITERSIQALINEDVTSLSKKNELLLHQAIFQQIQNALSFNSDFNQIQDKCSVHVYKLNKANGQNAQISYSMKSDQWLIASKNVAILAANLDDLKQWRQIQQGRYHFSCLIAQTWFKLLQQVPPNLIKQLKDKLSNHTLIGEYCGNQEYQHLVKYTQTTIYFYALVDNHNPYDSCIYPVHTFQFLHLMNLPIVKNWERAFRNKYYDLPSFGKGLFLQYAQVASATIQNQQEGSVLYFVLHIPKAFREHINNGFTSQLIKLPNDPNLDYRVLSLGKLKTLQYRFYRKLRQKLRSLCFVKPNNSAAQQFNFFQKKYGSYQKQCYALSKKFKLPRPIQYYFCVALISFQYVFTNRKQVKAIKTLQQNYLDFLNVILWCIENQREVDVKTICDQQLQVKLRQEKWDLYKLHIIEKYPQILNAIVPKYSKIKQSSSIEQLIAETQSKDHQDD